MSNYSRKFKRHRPIDPTKIKVYRTYRGPHGEIENREIASFSENMEENITTLKFLQALTGQDELNFTID